jgi:hypothetical protein
VRSTVGLLGEKRAVLRTAANRGSGLMHAKVKQ